MPKWKKNLWVIWVAQFLCLTGFWFAMPFIPYYIQKLGVVETGERNFWIAVYTIVGYIGVAVFSPLWGRVADRYGRKMMLLRACFCSALIVPFMGLVSNVSMLVLIRLLMGIFSGTTNAAQALVASETPHGKQGYALGMLSSSVYSGSMAGCMLGGIVVDHLGYEAAFGICGALFLVAGVIILIGASERAQEAQERVSAIHSHSAKPQKITFAWMILGLIVFMGLARQLDTPFLPLLVQDIHGSVKGAATWTGIVTGSTALAGMLAGPVLGMLSDKLSVPKVAIIAALLSGILMIPQGLAHNMMVLIPSRFMMIFFAGGLEPVFQIWLAKTTPVSARGIVFGWALTAKCMGWILAAGLSGYIATYVGLRWIYGVGCLLFLFLIPLIVVVAKRLESTNKVSRNSNITLLFTRLPNWLKLRNRGTYTPQVCVINETER